MRWVAGPLGLDTARDADEVIDAVNDIRSVLYAQFSQVPIEARRQTCVEVEKFSRDCHCRSCYYGFTLPEDAEQVLEIRKNDYQLPLHNGWTSPLGGICEIGKFDILDAVPTMHEHTPWDCPQHYGFSPEDSRDRGKEVTACYIDSAGEEREEVLVLCDEWAQTVYPVAKLKFVTLQEHSGRVFVRQEDGKLLSTFGRHDLAPQYRRVRLEGAKGCGKLFITYAKRFIPVSGGRDPVEVDNAMVWKHLAQYVKLNSRTSLESKERQEAEIHFAKAIDLLKGMHRREWGADEAILRKAPVFRRSSGLYSKAIRRVRYGC